MEEGKKYSERQLEVINVKHGYNMVLAGPGCGKTDILAERIARAYEEDGVAFSDMLCLTFTNRASRGMFTRIRERVGSESEELFVGNVHRYCSHFLFEESASGVTGESAVMDENDADEVLTSVITNGDIEALLGCREVKRSWDGQNDSEILIEFDWNIVNNFFGIDEHPSGWTNAVKMNRANRIIDAARKKIPDIQHLMYQVLKGHPRKDFYRKKFFDKNLLPYGYGLESTFEEYCFAVSHGEDIGDDYCVNALKLAYKYQDYKETNGLLDFDDLLLYTYDAYYNDKEQTYKRYKWIQIDEIQDLSLFQLSLVDLLTKKDDDFVVLYLGDEQQAIYSFMGASLDSLNDLKTKCEHIYRLDKNFRSPKYLLDIYNEYAVKELKVDQDFLPEPKDDKKAELYDVCLHTYFNNDEETDRVCSRIVPRLLSEDKDSEVGEKQKPRNTKTAILVPWNSDANNVSDKLNNLNIPHFKISGTDSFQSIHMKTLMAHLSAVSNDFNLIAWSRILKQTEAVGSYKEAREWVSKMRKIGICPSDLLREQGTYLSEFVNLFDNEEIVLYDTETTGLDVFHDDIVQIAAYKIRGGEIVPDSFFNIIMYTEREIPKKLGKIDNPLIELYETTENKYSREEGLSLFMEYVGDRILMGHNVNYDYNILKYNLKRDCGSRYENYNAQIVDTLKLAHLVSPRQRKYKLGYLVERFNLTPSDEQGLNYHQADEDIKATLALAKYCRTEAEKYLNNQYAFLNNESIKKIISKWAERGYKDCYLHSKERLYDLLSENEMPALTHEMEYASQELEVICKYKKNDNFDLIINFLNSDVISNPQPEPNALITHLSNHLMDLSTFKEADMCDSDSFKEKLFVSTVHKAKGLEFKNVIVLHSVVDRYPHFAHKTFEQQEEDKRLFYVAISRAMKRLIVAGESNKMTPFINAIQHNFTLRYELNDNIGIKSFIEIGKEKFRVTRLVQNKRDIRTYNIEHIYNEEIKGPLDLKTLLDNYRSTDDIFGTIDDILTHRGGYRE